MRSLLIVSLKLGKAFGQRIFSLVFNCCAESRVLFGS